MTKQGFIIALLVVVIGLFLLGASPFFIVDITQNAIVVQLGKPVRNLTEPGLYVKDAVYSKKSPTSISACWTTTQIPKM